MSEKEQDGRSPPLRSGSGQRRFAVEPVPVSSIAATPNAVDLAWDRLHKFAVEWKMLESRGGRDGFVYELHPGDPRHAICDINDIIVLLEAVNARAA